MVVLGGGPVLVLAGPGGARASGGHRASSAGGRRRRPVSPSASGSSSVSAYSDRWSGSERQRGVEGRHPVRERSGPGTSYSRSSVTDAMPPARAAATASATCIGAMPPARAAGAPVVEALRAEGDPRDARVARAPRVAALVGPGLASSVTSAPAREAEALADAREDRGRCVAAAAATACRRRGRRSRAAGAARPPNAGVAARRPAGRSRVGAPSTNAAMRARGPRAAAPGVHDEVAVRAERDAERTWSRARPVARRATGAAASAVGASAIAGDPMTGRRAVLPARRRVAPSSSTSRPARRGWPAWPVARKIANRVTAWPRNAAPMPPVMPSASRRRGRWRATSTQHVAVRARARRAAWRAHRRGLDDVREVRLDAGRDQERRGAAAERRPRR